ncbi:Major Facilitator Superfamily protein [Pseudarthrobacter equi]|uniref:Major Facilitator Superfamily protein n=1 Tax=Pseudarthrobacter equi TaxID=728066 RepID=A0A1H1YU05_9MICC|nr:MFS transporter [Pseudarthrobacter equi]SDT24506.1 Major Facilitator Superfamily protein [Pseudarthrobacter equi]
MKLGSPAAPPETRPGTSGPRAGTALAASVLGFFMITLDAVVVNVALPSIRADLGGGMTGLQWVLDGYTLMFAAFLLSAGAFSDRLGARRSFGIGLVLFLIASLACGVAPGMVALVAARFVQGAAAALMLPASMALIGEAYPEPVRRARAIAFWAMGGAIASTSGPVIGGLLSLASWRLIFLINIPVGVVALVLLARTSRSARHSAPIDWIGQTTAMLAMGGIIYGVIEAGAAGFAAPQVAIALTAGFAALAAFAVGQARGRHPMIPPELRRSRTLLVAAAAGFAFMVGYYGLPFVMSLDLQQHRGLSAFQTGIAFLPMMLTGLIITPFSARIVERFGARRLVTLGFRAMAVGLAAIALLPAASPVWVVSGLMVLVGLAGPLVMPPMTAALLNAVPGHLAGTASGIFNTSRQFGGALAVAVFGALLAEPSTFHPGLMASLLIAAAVALCAALASRQLNERNIP